MSGMKVLHFIPSLEAVGGSAAQGYMPALLEAMARRAYVRVIALCGGGAPMAGVDVHVSPAAALPWRLRRFFSNELAAFVPDVVHVHACWSLAAYVLSGECARRGIPVVISPGRRLEEWHVRRRYWLAGLPRLLLYQRRMLRRAGALHFVSAQEQARFAAFSWHPSLRARRSLNGRTAVIEPYSLSPGTTADGMSLSLLRLYRKVADSDPYSRMDAALLAAEDALLLPGMWRGFPGEGAVPPTAVMQVRALSDEQLRRICLHAYDEGVLDHVAYGLKAAGVDMPFADASVVDRFAPRRTAACDASGLGADSRRLARLKGGAALPPAERALCACMATLLRKAERGTARRADFVSMCLTLRRADYDEDTVSRKLSELGLLGGAARLLQIMKQHYGLGEGYMFADPVDDRKTAALRKKLFNK